MEKMLSIRLSNKVRERLNQAAINKGITASQYTRILICKALKIRLKDMNE